mmetsp:Transcript_16261/g.18090  ORF Transcript_16261/g.18090 Transcript_16261/m.18090 type:complete len:175 (+) Transcript_16261:15-539(+)
MANQSAKRIVKENKVTLMYMQVEMALFMVLYLLLRVWYFSSTYTTVHMLGTAVIVLVNLYVLWFMRSHAHAEFTPTGDIKSPGADLCGKGIIEYHWDALYITWFVQLACNLSSYFWFIFLIIPLFGIYKLWVDFIGPALAMRSGMAQRQEYQEGRRGMRKKERKALKKANRAKR